MDANNDMLFYAYDPAGRQTTVKDNNQDILSHTSYYTAGYVNVSATALNVFYRGSVDKIFVTANKNWTASSNQSWVSLSRDSNNPVDGLTITTAANTAYSSRTATITISSPGLTNQTLTLTQGPAPNSYITVPSLVTIQGLRGVTVSVSSNVSWTARVVIGSLSILNGSGQNNGSFTINIAPQQQGATISSGPLNLGSVEITGGGVTEVITVDYN